MGYRRPIGALLVLAACALPLANAQGGRGRGAAAPGAQPANIPGRGGRGGTAPPAGSAPAGPADLFNFDPNASGSFTAGADGATAESKQKVTINGQEIGYTARAGFLPLLDATSGAAQAHLFYTYYAKDGTEAGRPLVFFMGGAPGVAAAWQEFGGLGPRRYKADGNAWAENPHTILDKADLVFVNPVGTGFSRPDQPSWGPNFWTNAADAASLGEFVRGFVRRYNRAGAPLFVAAEDFGTARAAGVAAYLTEHQALVRGVVLLSITTSADSIAGDAQYLTLLPSLVMAAWHHKKLSPEMNAMSAEQIAGQARQFASREYLHALYKGERMTADERAKALNNLARLTGLSKGFLTANELRLTLDRFNNELLRDQRRGMAYSDARVTGFTPVAPTLGRGQFAGPVVPIDFNIAALSPGFLTAYERYLRQELTYSANPNGLYYLTGGGVSGFTSTGTDDTLLAGALARNPGLHLFVALNYFDLNSPFYATEFTLAHLSVSPEVRAHNISTSLYEAGQMPYADDKAAAKLQRDLGTFITEATSVHK